MSSSTSQDFGQKVSQQMSQLDASVRSTLSDLKQNGDSAYADFRQKGNATVSDLKSQGSSKLRPLIQRVNYASRNLWERYLDFTTDSPAVSALLTIQLLFAIIPLSFFLGFMLLTAASVFFVAGCIVSLIAFFAGCVLLSILAVTSFFAFFTFISLASLFLAARWVSAVRRFGVREGTRQFLFGVKREVRREVQNTKVYASKTEDKISEHTGQTKLEDFVPGAGSAA